MTTGRHSVMLNKLTTTTTSKVNSSVKSLMMRVEFLKVKFQIPVCISTSVQYVYLSSVSVSSGWAASGCGANTEDIN